MEPRPGTRAAAVALSALPRSARGGVRDCWPGAAHAGTVLPRAGRHRGGPRPGLEQSARCSSRAWRAMPVQAETLAGPGAGKPPGRARVPAVPSPGMRAGILDLGRGQYYMLTPAGATASADGSQIQSSSLPDLVEAAPEPPAIVTRARAPGRASSPGWPRASPVPADPRFPAGPGLSTAGGASPSLTTRSSKFPLNPARPAGPDSPGPGGLPPRYRVEVAAAGPAAAGLGAPASTCARPTSSFLRASMGGRRVFRGPRPAGAGRRAGRKPWGRRPSRRRYWQ